MESALTTLTLVLGLMNIGQHVCWFYLKICSTSLQSENSGISFLTLLHESETFSFSWLGEQLTLLYPSVDSEHYHICHSTQAD